MTPAALAFEATTPGSRGVHRRRTAVFRGDLRSITGYGYETRALARLLPPAWRVYGVDLHFNPVDAQGGFPGELISDDELARLCADRGDDVVVINNTTPDGYRYFPGAINIGSFYWETEAVPYRLDWPELIAAMDYNWAKSSFHQAFLRRCGWLGPAPIITWAFDFDKPYRSSPERLDDVSVRYVHALAAGEPMRLKATELRTRGEPLLISVSSLAPRKGLPILLSEWRDHLRAGGDGVLLLKLRPIHNLRLAGDSAAFMAEMLAETGFGPTEPVRIAYSFDDLEAEQLKELYLLCDAYVTASYGEGFGGPVVEALALHRPVISPRHSSLADILPQGYALEAPSSLEHVGLAGTPSIYPSASNWSLPARGGLASAFARFAAMTAAERAATAEQARNHAAAFCGRPVVAKALHDVLHRLGEA